MGLRFQESVWTCRCHAEYVGRFSNLATPIKIRKSALGELNSTAVFADLNVFWVLTVCRTEA